MTDYQPVKPLPGSIVKAIAAVQQTMQAVAKSQKNVHGNYMFASTDDIYAALTAKMGELGLICLCLEDGQPKISRVEPKSGDKASVWMEVSYRFILATESDTWDDPQARRTLLLQIVGPQTFQAAQSYAEKSWLRSLFKIPTGDVDLDSLPEGFSPPAFRAPAPPPATTMAVKGDPEGLGATVTSADGSLKADAAALKTATEPVKAPPPPPAAPEPAPEGPNMIFALANFEAALLNVSSRATAEKYLDAFNSKYDGHIGAEIGQKRDAAFEGAIAKLK